MLLRNNDQDGDVRNEEPPQWAINLAIYGLLSWLFYSISEKDRSVFWISFGCITGLRLFFYILEFVIDEVVWHLTKKPIIYAYCLKLLRSQNFPNPSKVLHHGFTDYLYRMRHPVNECDETVRVVASREWDNWTLIEPHLSKRQQRRYSAVMDKAFLEWFGERWFRPGKT
jgi:hypothetical protein